LANSGKRKDSFYLTEKGREILKIVRGSLNELRIKIEAIKQEQRIKPPREQ